MGERWSAFAVARIFCSTLRREECDGIVGALVAKLVAAFAGAADEEDAAAGVAAGPAGAT